MPKLYSILILGLLAPGFAFSQGLINNGAKVVITNGSNLYIDGTTGHFTNQNGGEITNNSSGGVITLGGNWTNNAANTVFSNTGSTVVFNSASAQSIGGTNSTGFYNLTANGNGTKTATGPASISNLVSVGSNTALNSNGNLTLTATATTNANVAPLLSGASVTGNVKVQSFFTGGSALHRSSRGISAPINETGLTDKTYKQLQGFMIVTGPSGAANGFDPGNTNVPYAVTLNKYNEAATLAQSQFTPVANISEALSPGFGVFVYYRGDRSGYNSGAPNSSNKLVAPFSVPESSTIQYVGPINQGDIVVNFSYTNNSGEDLYNGYNLIGNPYPAVIDWFAVTKNNVTDELKMLKPGGGFVTYKDNVITNAPEGVHPRYIQPGQAFYSKGTASGASVTFTESCKSVASTPVRLLYGKNDVLFNSDFGLSAAPATVSSNFNKLLRMNLSNGIDKEEAVAVFKSGKSAKGGSEDALFFGGSTVALSTLSSDNVKLTINFMPELANVTELKLSLTATNTSNVSLNFTDLSAVENTEVFLKDNYLNATVDVKANPSYSFTIDKAVAASYGDNRMSLLFKQVTTLPLATTSFKGQKGSAGALLTWASPSEADIAKYIVQRVVNGNVFETLATLDAIGKSSYSFTDVNPQAGDNFYRLQLMDKSGNIVNSYLTSVNYTLNGAQLTVFPNPTSEKYTVDFKRSGNTKVVLYDLSGNEVRVKSFSKTETIQDNITALLPGVYVLHLIDETSNKIIGQTKLVKN